MFFFLDCDKGGKSPCALYFLYTIHFSISPIDGKLFEWDLFDGEVNADVQILICEGSRVQNKAMRPQRTQLHVCSDLSNVRNHFHIETSLGKDIYFQDRFLLKDFGVEAVDCLKSK